MNKLNKNYTNLLLICDRLFSAVSEQQHTLSSYGWKKEGKIEYSKAGARKFQFDEIEYILEEYRKEHDNLFFNNEITEKISFVNRLIKIRDMALELCDMNHIDGCICKQCKLINLILNSKENE